MIGPGSASSPLGTISMSAMAMAIEAMIVAVPKTSFIFHLQHSKMLNNVRANLTFHDRWSTTPWNLFAAGNVWGPLSSEWR